MKMGLQSRCSFEVISTKIFRILEWIWLEMNVILTNLPQAGNLVGNLYGCYHIRCYMINVEVKNIILWPE